MDRYTMYRALGTNTVTNVICNELLDELADNPTDDMINAVVVVLFHNRAPETGYTRNEIRELVEATLNF